MTMLSFWFHYLTQYTFFTSIEFQCCTRTQIFFVIVLFNRSICETNDNGMCGIVKIPSTKQISHTLSTIKYMSVRCYMRSYPYNSQ